MLGHNPTQMDSYNKNTIGKGTTLIANWFQEQVHQSNKGQGRSNTRAHVPKKHEQLMNSQSLNLKNYEDDTKYRIHGDVNNPSNRSQNYHYGKGYNKAQSFPKTGRKQQLVQQMYLQQITQQIQQKQQHYQQQSRKGIFTTTNRQTFIPKPLNQNVIGKLIMYDQNGRDVDLENVDEDLRTTNGFKDRGQITPNQELENMINASSPYDKQQPITFWRQKLENGTFYMSKNASNQPFAKNNDFLRTFKHYKHYKD